MTGAAGQMPDESHGWPSSRAELDEVFGVVGARFDAEWTALDGPGVVSMQDADMGRLYAAHGEAKALSRALGAALGTWGLSEADFPQMCGKVDAQGRPMVMIGGVSAATVARLLGVLLGPGAGSGGSRPAVGPT